MWSTLAAVKGLTALWIVALNGVLTAWAGWGWLQGRRLGAAFAGVLSFLLVLVVLAAVMGAVLAAPAPISWLHVMYGVLTLGITVWRWLERPAPKGGRGAPWHTVTAALAAALAVRALASGG